MPALPAPSQSSRRCCCLPTLSLAVQPPELSHPPERFLLHTHAHADHLMGDSEFRAAFPGLAVASSNSTQMATAELALRYIRGDAEAGAANGAVLRKQIQNGKDHEGKALTDADQHYLTDYANSIDFAVPEYKQYRTILPNVSFVPDANVVMARPGRARLDLPRPGLLRHRKR